MRLLRRRPAKVVVFVDKGGFGRFHVVYPNSKLGPVSQGYAPDNRRTGDARRASALRSAERAARRDHPDLEVEVQR